MDSITIDALRMAFAVSLERYQEERAGGRSHEFAIAAATSAVVPRMEAALEGHELRRHVCAKPGKDFRYEALHALDCFVKKVRTGTTYGDAVADYWRQLSAAVIHKELF